MCGRFFESPSSFGLGPAKRGIPSAVSKEEAFLMSVNRVEGRDAQERSRCQIGHVPGKSCSSCAEPAREEVDGLLLCERHALEAKLEGQIECWEEMLFHIELWSKEAKRQNRPDVARLLGALRAQIDCASQRAWDDLDVLRSETPRERLPWERTKPSRQDSLPLPPSGALPLFPGLRRLRRR